MSVVAFLGLGAMGLRMARNLIKAGHQVVVYNRTKAAAQTLEAEGAKRASTPREAAERADIVISMVTDDHASRVLWLDERTGAVAGLRAGAVAIESSTVTPAWVHALATAVAAQGAAFLDAPVVGSRPQAETAALIYLVGGAAETLERVRSALSAMGSTIHHLGPVGMGAVMKLAVNALFGIQVAAMAELLGVVAKSGIERAHAVEVLGTLPLMSPAMKGVASMIASRSFAPLFPIDLVDKDLGYLVDTAQRVQAWAPTATRVREVYARAKEAGHGGDNITGVAQLFD